MRILSFNVSLVVDGVLGLNIGLGLGFEILMFLWGRGGYFGF